MRLGGSEASGVGVRGICLSVEGRGKSVLSLDALVLVDLGVGLGGGTICLWLRLVWTSRGRVEMVT